MPNYQPDPRYFDIGGQFLRGKNIGQENQRQNALMDLGNRRQSMYENQNALENQRYADQQSQQQAQAQKEREAGLAIFRQFGIPEDWIDSPEGKQIASHLIGQQVNPPQPKLVEDASGQLVPEAPGIRPYHAPTQGAQVNSQVITRPIGGGMVQDYSRDPRTGKRVPEGAPYKPADGSGALQQGERTAAALSTRLTTSLNALNEIEARSPGASRPGLLEKGAQAVGSEIGANLARSDDRQQANAAQLDALDAALTLATGAAYTSAQLANLATAYFPQIGDTDNAVKAKKAKFDAIVNAARISAGRAGPLVDQAVAASSPSRPGQSQSGPEITATGPNGEKIALRNGQWVPL